VSGVHLLGVGATSLSRRRRESRSLAREAIAAALADAGVSPREVDGLAIASANVGFDLGCYDVLGRDRRPFRCRCGLGSIALHSGWNAIAAGASEIVVCVGHDSPPPRRRPASFEAQAATARLYMRHSGATEEHLARVAAKNLSNGAANPRAPVARGQHNGGAQIGRRRDFPGVFFGGAGDVAGGRDKLHRGYPKRCAMGAHVPGRRSRPRSTAGAECVSAPTAR